MRHRLLLKMRLLIATRRYAFTSGNNTDMRMANNLLRMQVYFSSLSIEKIEARPKYQVH